MLALNSKKKNIIAELLIVAVSCTVLLADSRGSRNRGSRATRGSKQSIRESGRTTRVGRARNRSTRESRAGFQVRANVNSHGHEPEPKLTEAIAPVILELALATQGVLGYEIGNTIVLVMAAHTGETIDDNSGIEWGIL